MQEFTTVSSSSYDPAALATKLTEKSADGWSVVSIVSTGGDVTAFLSRESTGAASSSAASSTASSTTLDSGSVAVTAAPAAVVEPEPAPAAEPAVAEPAGWAVAPDPAPAAVVDPVPASTYTPAATTAYTPAPAAAAAATPAVPAGWYADPAGRFELRYWDGGTWTEHVSRAGQQYTDPPVA
ncbi:MAG: DUF2510 domain-containing protein [Actinobacteria bacterium]|nr:DUF2510 domain-containing protein [Actinomycetota bacterium]